MSKSLYFYKLIILWTAIPFSSSHFLSLKKKRKEKKKDGPAVGSRFDLNSGLILSFSSLSRERKEEKENSSHTSNHQLLIGCGLLVRAVTRRLTRQMDHRSPHRRSKPSCSPTSLVFPRAREEKRGRARERKEERKREDRKKPQREESMTHAVAYLPVLPLFPLRARERRRSHQSYKHSIHHLRI